MFYYLFILLVLLQTCQPLPRGGWHDVNIHCRDNENNPLDWWYIIKPPGPIAPLGDSGRNFSYISSPSENLRWTISDRSITSENMLMNTVNVLYKATYTDHLAYAVFEAVPSDIEGPGSTSNAVLLANEVGGLFILHTVPKLINWQAGQFDYPDETLRDGHVLSCMSTDHASLENIAIILKNSGAVATDVHVPDVLKSILPSFHKFNSKDDNKITGFEFVTDQQWLHGFLTSRKPGESIDLYEEFAKKYNVIFDIYSPVHKTEKLKRPVRKNVCYKDYGIRNIPSIVLKTKETVEYINPDHDKLRFGVTTTAHWQTRGSAKNDQYWVCIGSVGKDDPGVAGAVLFCAENNYVWTNFDNLKVKEPECNNQVKNTKQSLKYLKQKNKAG